MEYAKGRRKRMSQGRTFKTPIAPSGGTVDRFAFTGYGFMPDLFSESGIAVIPEASATNLEGGFVPGVDGMLPPGGNLGKVQSHAQPKEEGSGGAGSFLTVPAFRAKG